jgi:hypothetical protein
MARKETYTREEVEALLRQVAEEMEGMVHVYYQKEAERNLPPVWLAVTIISTMVLCLWGLAIWA